MNGIYKKMTMISALIKINKCANNNAKDEPSLISYRQFIQQVVRNINASFKNRVKPLPPDLIKTRPSEVMWRIHLGNKNNTYIKLNISTCVKDSYIIYADTEMFYLLILDKALKADQQDVINACRIYRNKPKFNSEKLTNQRCLEDWSKPIRLDVLNSNSFDVNLNINFVDGMTQSLWLIANYASSFPILTSGLESATLLNDIVGITDHPIPVEELIS